MIQRYITLLFGTLLCLKGIKTTTKMERTKQKKLSLKNKKADVYTLKRNLPPDRHSEFKISDTDNAKSSSMSNCQFTLKDNKHGFKSESRTEQMATNISPRNNSKVLGLELQQKGLGTDNM